MFDGNVHAAVALERDLSGEHLVQNDSERVDVGLPGHLVSQCLLRRHVVGRPDHLPGAGQVLRLELQVARDAEVGDLGAPLLVDQDVVRFHVTVDELALVSCLQRAADLDRVGDGLARPAAFQPCGSSP